MRDTERQYRDYWATVAHRNPADVYIPEALRDDEVEVVEYEIWVIEQDGYAVGYGQPDDRLEAV